MTSYTRALAQFFSETAFSDLPEGVVESTKRLITDVVANTVGGSASDSGRIALEYALDQGGAPQASILATSDRTAVSRAAFVNVTMASAFSSDDTIYGLGHWGHCSVLPALAAIEKVGGSGRDFIAAAAAAFETGRIGHACQKMLIREDGEVQKLKLAGMNWKTFAAAVGTGKILGLSPEQMADALGVAGYSAPVVVTGKWVPSPRPHTKYCFYGHMAESGAKSALLASMGFTGDRAIFDGDLGWWRMTGALACDWSALTSGLGEEWLVESASFKPYPSCSFAKVPLDLFRSFLQETGITRDEIASVEIDAIQPVLNFHMDRPEAANERDVQFSLPFLFAIATTGESPGPGWMGAHHRNDPELQAFARKVKVQSSAEADDVVFDETVALGRHRRVPTRVLVRARGESHELEGDFGDGDCWTGETRWHQSDLDQKFAQYCEGRLADPEMALRLIGDLESLDDLTPLVDSLTQRT